MPVLLCGVMLTPSSGPVAVEDDLSGEIPAGFVPEIALPRVLQRPEIVMLSKQLGPESRRRHQGSHKKIEALHYAIDRKDDAGVFLELQTTLTANRL